MIDADLPRNSFSMNGEWFIAPGNEREPAEEFHRTIQVPSVVDCSEPSLTGDEAEYYWYECKFLLGHFNYDSELRIIIEQAQFGTAVWIDGSFAGSSIACYTSQEYRIDHLLSTNTAHTIRIRVGSRQTLPPESPGGRDIEKTVYTPGIWGDVSLTTSGSPHIQDISILPSLKKEEARIVVTLHNSNEKKNDVSLNVIVFESRSGKKFSECSQVVGDCRKGISTLDFIVPMEGCRSWSPDDPFLYSARVDAAVSGAAVDRVSVRFGMRDFRIVGNEFHLNGKRIFLKGGNIAFHRFLADAERKLLPWDMEWVRRVFIDIPKEHNFNFFRFHLGHAYNRWYDLADEHGILIQDEWPFWNATGSNAEIEKEFSQWIRDNANHPSIIIWDPLNESTDDSIIRDIVPRMRELDPTRPWEAADFHEQHPYIYSLGMTLNDRQFGHTMALSSLERSPEPVVVNEFLWWWFDSEWRPTVLMKDVVERWLGRTYTTHDIIDRQSSLAEELVGFFRRMRCAAIQPFVYLSNNQGPTAHWFEGPISLLKPKPLLKALKNAFSSVGVSIELWDRHFFGEEVVTLAVHVFNDEANEIHSVLAFEIVDEEGQTKSLSTEDISIGSMERMIVRKSVVMPERPGRYTFWASVSVSQTSQSATSKRTVYVIAQKISPDLSSRPLVLLDPMSEVESFLTQKKIPFSLFTDSVLTPDKLIFVNTFGLEQKTFSSRLAEVTKFLDNGGTLVVQEPEFRTVEPKELKISEKLGLHIERRNDADKGGYDSYVFPEDDSHPLWRGINSEHLRWFNGALGGEIVSEYTLTLSLPSIPLASCGLGLRIPAVILVNHGKGRVIISRIQVRGRLMNLQSTNQDRFVRRPDPVAMNYLFNLISL